MNNKFKFSSRLFLLCFVFVVNLASNSVTIAAPVDLSKAPLADSTITEVLPNIMFILDDSGSMNRNYLPDWVTDSYCKNNTDGTYNASCNNQPPFRSYDVNGVYYNPAITYTPPVNSDKSSRASQTSWTNVKNDAYNIQDTNSTNLVTNYSDVEWCTDSTYTDCLRNDNYILPGVVNSKNYRTLRPGVNATGTGLVATGNSVTPITATRTFGPHYYKIIPGEFCDSELLTNCQTVQTATFNYPARVRWCKSTPASGVIPARTAEQNATIFSPQAGACQAARKEGTFDAIRYPTKFFQPPIAAIPPTPAVLPVAATGAFTINGANRNQNATIGSVQVNGVNIMCGAATSNSSSTTATTRYEALAQAVVNAINACTTNPEYTATRSGATVNISSTLAAGATANGAISTSGLTNGASRTGISGMSGGVTAAAATPGTPAQAAIYPGSFQRVDIVTGQTYAKSEGTRSDCLADTFCTYNEEMTNFANWWTYYRTRMQAMKTAVSLAFKDIGTQYRVGFTTINNTAVTNGTEFQGISKFDATQKSAWYNKLFAQAPGSGTPLRSALARAGLMYANKLTGQTDPMQYSCQQNFTILSTDGYWNGGGGVDLSNSSIGNLDAGPIDLDDSDGKTTTREMIDTFGASNTLADVAKYYYDNDLRTVALGNCVGAPVPPATVGNTLCANPVPPIPPDTVARDVFNNVFVSNTDRKREQHMTTFTMGLGMDGSLAFKKGYQNADSTGDFDRLRKGTTPIVTWPDPSDAEDEDRVDDLWHAAVNGHGLYFSAKNPADIVEGFKEALDTIKVQLGAGAAAATSTLNPVQGESNLAYVASYTTVQWTGNLEARAVSATTGEVSKTPTWCVEPIQANEDVVGCDISLASMPKKFNGLAAPRKIWTKGPGEGTWNNFNLTSGALNVSNFNATKLAGLSQWVDLDTTQRSNAVAKIVDYLRGDQTNEYDAADFDDRLFRTRVARLGDAVESQPAFVGKPTFNYIDAGYSTFKSTESGREGTVYMGANDGMMHAFNASNGDERWAYVPTMLHHKMFALADKEYATKHEYYANGSPIIADVQIGGAWKTILVAGLNGGGRGYYALDITKPDEPSLLWEFTPSSPNGQNLGFTFGNPVITKKNDGTWVVLLTSGHSNVPDTSPRVRYPTVSTGDGRGYLYVVDAGTGALIGSPIGTGAGSTTTPSGLSNISAWAEEPEKNNTATFVYGGDLEGNLWRFDINAGTVDKFASLGQPITTRPELGKVLTSDGQVHRVVFVGTGKYLEVGDLTDTSQQTIYAIKDDFEVGDTPEPTLTNLRTTTSGPNRMAKQTLSGGGASRTIINNADPVDFSTDRGWFVDLQPGERQNVPAKLVLGTLIVPTTVPSNTVCAPGGSGWLNFFDYDSGGAVTGSTVSTVTNSPIVGINVIYVTDTATGKKTPKVSTVTADNPTPTLQPNTPFNPSGSGFQSKRAIWREIIDENK